jgi:hypothetical protein
MFVSIMADVRRGIISPTQLLVGGWRFHVMSG